MGDEGNYEGVLFVRGGLTLDKLSFVWKMESHFIL